MAEKKKPTDEQTEGAPLDERDAEAIKPTSGDPIAPERQLPDPAGPGRYVVQRDALGRWRRGDEVTADDVGGEERLRVLVERGALAPVEA